jgi:putative membrane protein
MTEQSLTANPVATMSTRRRWAALGAVVLVPLAFAGLFVAAIGSGGDTITGIPAAIVNEDSLITTTASDGTETNVFAGRQLVTELTADDATGFDWTISNAEDAAAALKAGDVYAVLTIPSNFSTSIMSVQTDSPEQAHISIRTDDAHSYLTTTLAGAVGDGMAHAFGTQITAQVLGGIYSSYGDIGNAFTQAADGAGKLADGSSKFTTGLESYTGGVSSLASGLGQLNSGAKQLSQLSSGIGDYTDGVTQLSGTLASINGDIQSNPNVSAYDKAVMQGVVDGLAQASAGGGQLDAQASSAISGIQSGISQSAKGARTLSSNGPALVTGAKGITSGARDLSTGLADGAKQLPSSDPATTDAAAEVAADPVSVTVDTNNPVTDIGQISATFLVPLGLWIGALAVFLVLRPISRRALASTAANSRLVASALIRASAVTLAQAALLVLLLHVSLGVAWSLLPVTVLFSVIMALAFTAFHYLLTVWVGRAGLVVSLFVLAIQITATGGIYPIELLAAPFQAISPFLPLTYGVSGMQAIIAGGSVAGIVTASLALVAFGAASVIASLIAIRRTRRAAAIGLLPRTA